MNLSFAFSYLILWLIESIFSKKSNEKPYWEPFKSNKFTEKELPSKENQNKIKKIKESQRSIWHARELKGVYKNQETTQKTIWNPKLHPVRRKANEWAWKCQDFLRSKSGQNLLRKSRFFLWGAKYGAFATGGVWAIQKLKDQGKSYFGDNENNEQPEVSKQFDNIKINEIPNLHKYDHYESPERNIDEYIEKFHF